MTDRAGSGRSRAPDDKDASDRTVASLLEERSRYQAWMDALDAKRGSSPEHVFRRVRKDYETRLGEVARQLARQLPALRDATRDLAERIAAARTEETALRDERAEAELRAHVGELADGKWETMAREHDARIAAVAKKREALEAELASVEELVASARDSIEMAAIPSDEAEGAEAAGDDEGEAESEEGGDEEAAAPTSEPKRPMGDELEFLRSVTGTGAPAVPSAPATQPRGPRRVIRSGAAPDKAPEKPVPEKAPEPVAAKPAPSAPPEDEIRADPSPMKEEPPANRPSGERFFSDEVNPLGDARTVERPLAGNILGNDALVLRADSSQPKTLKCADCGTMNYPTEWYCERCGAELAVL